MTCSDVEDVTQPPPQWRPPGPPQRRQAPPPYYGPPPQQWGPPPQWQQQPPPPERPPNVAAIISIVCGILGLVIFPLVILLGPIALITGCVGEYLATRRGWNLRWTAAAGVVLGAVGTLIAFVAVAS